MTATKRSFDIILCVAMLLAFLLAGLVLGTDPVYAKPKIHLTNGQTYDVSQAKKNTILFIDDNTCNGTGGTGYVRLRGKSTYVWVHIAVSRGKTVTVDLADGLSILPGSDSDFGIGSGLDSINWSRSGIYINETKSAGGIVVLRSEPGARIIIDEYQQDGYQSLPAIMKNDNKTKLVFSTVDPNNPGTIIARPTRGPGTAAIGAYGHSFASEPTSSYTVGNIEFRSGNIEAYGLVDGTGIGAYECSHVSDLTFSGAHVKAVAGNGIGAVREFGSAGIGGSWRGNVDRIDITGGYVEAWGYGSTNDANGWPLRYIVEEAGCGIGVGNLGHLGEINISGGTVLAVGGSASIQPHARNGAGIGTLVSENDKSFSTADHINITGGVVTAYGGDYACGIGGCVGNITISPSSPGTTLKVNALIDSTKARNGKYHVLGAGIGISGNINNANFSKYPGIITITGGEITATSGSVGDRGYYGDGDTFFGAGIGSCRCGRVSCINITGGKISANGGWSSPGIGGWEQSDGKRGSVDRIHISGGTITAKKASQHANDAVLSGIGGCSGASGARTDIRITGGCIFADGTDYAIGYDDRGQPKNDADEIVYGTKFRFIPDPGEWTKIDSFDFSPELGYDYGFNDVYTGAGLDSMGNITELWLPYRQSEYSASTNLANYRYGSFDNASGPATFQAGDTVALSACTAITYVNGITGDKYTGYGVYGSDKLSISPAPAAVPHYTLTGYKERNGKMVANGSYGSTEAPLVRSTSYVDANGKWKAKETSLTLDMILEQTDYRVHYDKNKPANASNPVTGDQMADSTFSCGQAGTLPASGYSLKGWRFTGWNTKPDGSGDSFANTSQIQFKKEWGETLTLYGQWEALPYTITYQSGYGQSHTQSAVYDTAGTLDRENTFGWSIPGEQSLHGWSSEGFGSFYDDGEDYFNLCTLNADGIPTGKTLTAEWLGKGEICISVTNDGAPVSGLGDRISLVSTSTGTPVSVSVAEVPDKPGMYKTTNASLPEGNYQLSFNGDVAYIVPEDQREFQFDNTKSKSIVLDYYTVTMTADPDDSRISAYVSRSGGTTQPSKVEYLSDGEQIQIHATGQGGYHFDGYTGYGALPEGFIPLDDGKPDQQNLIVQGTAVITAHSEANLYQVEFAPNKPQNASHEINGEMQKQDFVYDEPQKLWENHYTLKGWRFDGWDTKADGTGDRYADRTVVSNLTTEENGTVTLYAQWAPGNYTVYFSATGATSGGMAPQEFLYDDAQRLTRNDYRRKDWHFTGWNTAPTGNGTDYEDEQEVINLTEGRSFTLYAQWMHDFYTVNFDKNDAAATGRMEPEHVWTNCAYELPLCSYHRKGYAMDSWNTRPDGSGKRYEDGEALENAAGNGQTVTLYAQWKPIRYNVTFDANTGAGSMAAQSFTYDQVKNLTACSFRKKHYVFKEWNTLADGTGTAYADKESVKNLTWLPGDTVTLYAQWKKAKYTIRYDLNGGKLKSKTGRLEVTCTYGDTIKLPAPRRKGYNFLYWKGSRYKAGASYTVTGNHVFTAQWKKKAKPNPVPVKVSGTLMVKLLPKGKRSLTLTWTKIAGADGYDIFFAHCNCGKKTFTCQKVNTLRGSKTLTWTKTKLRKGVPYKAYVRAYTLKNKKKTYVRTSPLVHAYTSGHSRKYTNAKRVKLVKPEKARITLRTGKTFTVRAKVIRLRKGQKLISEHHAPRLRYLSTNRKVASVSKSGRISARAKGTCKIYIFAHNGVKRTLTVTVK